MEDLWIWNGIIETEACGGEKAVTVVEFEP